MKTKSIIKYISNWLISYSKKSNTRGFVIGISGGIDSAVTSVLAARTGIPLICIEMPIYQNNEQVKRGSKHIKWLKSNFKHVTSINMNLSSIFDEFTANIPDKNTNELALANTRARLRMTTLYYFAQANNYLVLGTGNKVEDFGIGFFTKYGDGGVDISPIADLLKSEIYLSRSLCSGIYSLKNSSFFGIIYPSIFHNPPILFSPTLSTVPGSVLSARNRNSPCVGKVS